MKRFFKNCASVLESDNSGSESLKSSTKTNGQLASGSTRTVSFVAGVAAGISLATVVFILFVSLLLVIPQQTASGAFDEPGASTPEHPQRSIRDIRKDLEAFMKNTRQEDDYNLQVGAAIDLCRLHQEIVTDPRYDTHSQLVSFRAVAASRLKRYAKYVETEMKRREKEKERAERDHRREQRLRERNGDDNASDDDAVQHGDDLNGNENGQGDGEDADEFDESESTSDSDDAINDSMNDSMFSMGSATGGPVNVMNYLGGSYAPPWDHGFELLELIQNTINPEFWRNNGGTGVIEYYRPSRVLVISATSDVHDRIEGLLEVLKWNSR